MKKSGEFLAKLLIHCILFNININYYVQPYFLIVTEILV